MDKVAAQNTLYPFLHTIFTRTWLFVLVYLVSCQSPPPTERDHPAQLAAIFQHVSSLEPGAPETIIFFLDSSYAGIPNPGPADLYRKYSYKLEHYLLFRHRHDTAMLYADSLFTILRPHATDPKYNQLYAEAYLYKGDVLLKEKQYDEAFIYFYQGKNSLLPTIDSCTYFTFLAHFNTRLANISYGQERYTEAAIFYKKAVSNTLQCNTAEENFSPIPGLFNNIGLCFSQLGLYDSALHYYQESMQTLGCQIAKNELQRKFNESTIGVIYGNQGTVYLQKGNIPLAEQKFRQSIAINNRKGYDMGDALLTEVKLAELYMQTRRIGKVATLLEQIEKDQPKTLSQKYQFRLLQVKASYAAAQGEMEEAYNYLQQYRTQKNAIEKEKTTATPDFIREFELLGKQYEVSVLKKQNQLTSFYLLAALSLCLMATVILYLTLKSRKQARANAQQTVSHNRHLELMLSALEKSNHEYAQLLRVVAHDLKNPVSAIYLIADMMLNEESRSVDDKEMLQLVSSASTNLNSIIQDLLTSRINSKATARKELADVQELLQQSVTLLRYRAEEKNQQIWLGEHISCLVFINRERIWRVINNLVVNALKFSADNSTIEVDWTQTEREVIIWVKDEGIGIPAGLKEKIFHLFGEAKREGTSGEETFGMGLFISRQIIEEHGGRIWLESTPGKGSTFYIALQLPSATE